MKLEECVIIFWVFLCGGGIFLGVVVVMVVVIWNSNRSLYKYEFLNGSLASYAIHSSYQLVRRLSSRNWRKTKTIRTKYENKFKLKLVSQHITLYTDLGSPPKKYWLRYCQFEWYDFEGVSEQGRAQGGKYFSNKPCFCSSQHRIDWLWSIIYQSRRLFSGISDAFHAAVDVWRWD